MRSVAVDAKLSLCSASADISLLSAHNATMELIYGISNKD